MNKVAAIVLNYNSSNDTKKCIDKLLKQENIDLDIILVDNNSSKEGEIDELKKLCGSRVLLIENHENKGYSAGNNLGLELAYEKGYTYAMIINPDVEIKNPMYVNKIINISSEYSDVAMIGTKIILPDGTNQNPQIEPTFFMENFWFWQFIIRFFKKDIEWRYAEDKTGYCDKLSGACFVVKLDDFKKVDFFDDKVFMYCEEAIIAAKMRRINKKLLYVSELVAYHNHYKEEKANVGKRFAKALESRRYYIRNYSKYNFFAKKILIISNYFQDFCYRVKNRKDM